MSLALNCLALRPDGAGVSTYIRELLDALPERVRSQATVVVQRDAIGEIGRGYRARALPNASGALRAFASVALMPQASVFHGLDTDLPVRSRGALVSTIHDLSVFDVPWAFGRTRVVGERLLVARAVARADVLIAVSEFTADRIRARFGRESTVVPLAAPSDMRPPAEHEVAAIRARHDLPETFVLYVGTVEPRKDVPRLADACRLEGVPLVIAGGSFGTSSLPGHVRRLGFVPRHELPALYSAATAVAYTSLYEGFGLPPLEALACGALVMCGRVASLPSLLDDAVIWTEPGKIDSIRRAVRSATGDADIRAALAPKAEAALAKLSWSSNAAATMTIYRELGLPCE